MSIYLFDQKVAITKLNKFFVSEKPQIDSFGKMVNQTFEAYTFASTIEWYKRNGWTVKICNPKVKGMRVFKLKFTTWGCPKNFTYAICKKNSNSCQIRHQLRVNTKSYKDNNKFSANMCCDIVILKNIDLDFFSPKNAISNNNLISFGEVKHMSAFAELIAGFIGVVHELQPKRLKKIRIRSWAKNDHISPYLNVSGRLQPTANGLVETIKKRKYDIDVYNYENKINS